jgi:hypothetical protein
MLQVTAASAGTPAINATSSTATNWISRFIRSLSNIAQSNPCQ